MDANAPNAVLAPPHARGGGAAVRGGRGGHRGGKAKGLERPKLGPNRALEGYEWQGEKALKESFTISISGADGAQTWTIHRPIGRSGIARPEGAWVATFTPEVAFLLERKEPPAWKTWTSQRSRAISDHLLEAAGNGRQTTDGVIRWGFEGSPPCGEEILRLQATAKAAGADQSKWLDYATDAIKAQEGVWKDRNKTAAAPALWAREHPEPTARTLGGPLGNQEQTVVAYLQGKDLRSARDSVMRKLIGVAG